MTAATTGSSSWISPDEKKFLLELARDTIRARASGLPLPEVNAGTAALRRKAGAFVSLHREGMLRGCIGYIEPVLPLAEAVQEMALSAAFRDPRFTPLSEAELEGLEIEISVLTPFEKITDVSRIEVGRHGLMIRMTGASGLLLPQVPVQFGWDRETFLAQTCRKAGLDPGAWKEPDAELFVFSAEIF